MRNMKVPYSLTRLLIVLFLAVGVIRGGTILVSPTTVNLTQGQSVTVDVDVDSIADLYAYQFDFSFDPTILQATSVAEGGFLSGAGSTLFFPGTIDNVGGTITTNANSLETAVSGASGGGALVRFMFLAIAPGASQNDISNVLLLDSNLDGITADIGNGSVIVAAAPAPEPSPVVLMLMGGALMFILRRFLRNN
jgi:hypothetical protein